MYHFYLLWLDNQQIYTGTTSNLKRRLQEHEDGKVLSTKYKRPLKLIHCESYLLKSDVSRRERFLKTTEGKRLLKQQLRDILNKCRGSSCHTTGRHVG